MLRLANADQAQLRRAILGAYPGAGGVNRLIMALAEADIDISRYFGFIGTGIEAALFDAIQELNAQGRITDVIGAARRGNSADPDLAAFEKKLLRTVAAPETTRLEGMIIEELQYHPAPDWLRELGKSFDWVCRVERASDGKAVGTGFLVADDLVLTNYHVLYGRGGQGPTAVQLRFDAAEGGGDQVVQPDARPQPIEKSPPGGAEWGAAGDPSTAELDFALIGLSQSIGAQRGHAKADVGPTAAGTGKPLVILEHPTGAPLQLCLGSITGQNPAGTRIQHNATTQEGSSGSPCLSMELGVVALHNGGVGTKHNTAVPFSAIQAMLRARGIEVG